MPDTHRCPTCAKEISGAVKNFPFCSSRCRDVDLGNWLLERYRIPERLAPEEDGDEQDPGHEEGD